MSETKIYVGNLPYSTTSNDLDKMFSEFGVILEVKLIEDRDTGRSKGFSFITFETPEAAQAALKLDQTTMDGRQIKVNIAQERTGSRDGGRGGFGGGERSRH